MNNDMIRLTASPKPFGLEKVDGFIPTGQSLEWVVDNSIGRQNGVFISAQIDGIPILPELWRDTYPKAGQQIVLSVIPQGGGGGSKVLRTVAMIALIVVSQGSAAGVVGGWFGGGQALGSALIMTAGSLLINAIIPPPVAGGGYGAISGQDKDSNTYSVSGARNRINPFGVVPVILGTHRVFPPMGALPYTEIVGNDQYLRLLFVIGYGPLQLNSFRIGETPLEEYDDVQIEVRSGYDTDSDLTLFTNDIYEDQYSLGLTNAGGFETRTTQPNCDEISVDVTCPRGLIEYNDQGGKVVRQVEVDVQYAPTGTSDWSVGTDYVYKSAQLSSHLPPATYYYNSEFFQNYELTRVIHRIAIDKATGVIKLFEGTQWDVSGAYSISGPEPPPIPYNYSKIAKVLSYYDVATDTIKFELTDERGSDLYSLNSTDFTPTLTGDQVSVTAGFIRSVLTIRAQTSSPVRKSLNFKVPTGQYDVRVKRLTSDSTGERIFDTTALTSLRSISYVDPINFTQPLAMVAMRIKATGQLNGIVDTFNCIATSIFKEYNSALDTWVEKITSNPSAIFRGVLQHPAFAQDVDDANIDIDGLESVSESCLTNGWTFNHVVDYRSNVEEMLQNIASAARGTKTYMDGKRGIVQDIPQSVPVQHITPKNSWGFTSKKIFVNTPHAYRVTFSNEQKNYAVDERIVYADGYDETNATLFETLDLVKGVTNSDLAWKHARYFLASSKLRPEEYSRFMDIEHLVCTKLDLVKVSDDVMLVGLTSGRVKTVSDDGTNITGVTTDETVTFDPAKTYCLRFRLSDGSSLLKVVDNPGAVDTNTFIFTDQDLIAYGPEIGDLMMFGESGLESADYVIKSIIPQSDEVAQIFYQDAAPEIHDADSGTIPAFNPSITLPAFYYTPGIVDVRSDESTLTLNGSGTLVPQIVVTIGTSSESIRQIKEIEFQHRITNTDQEWISIKTSYDTNTVFIGGYFTGESVDIKCRYLYEDLTVGKWSPAYTENVIGFSTLPPDVENFVCNIIDTQANLSWDSIIVADISHYKIKYNDSTTGATWGNSVVLVSKVSIPSTSVTVPALIGSYLIKAVDFKGNESENATIVTSNIASIFGLNLIETLTEDPDFDGVKEDTTVRGGFLQLNGADLMSDWVLMSNVTLMSLGEANSLASEGYYYFDNSLDLGSKYTSRVNASFTVVGENIGDLMSLINLMSEVELMSGTDPSSYSVVLQIRTTDDDPTGTPTWSSWQNFVVGDYSARAFQFRIKLMTDVNTVTPSVSELSVTIDMPDRIYGDDDIVSDAAGSTITFSPAFKVKPIVTITEDNGQTGDYYTITNKTESGFTIRFFNSSATGVSRQFDYLAKGYGEVI